MREEFLEGLSTYQAKVLSPAGHLEGLPNIPNLHTVAVLPVSPDVPATAFSLELTTALSAIKPTLRLSRDVVTRHLGDHIFDQFTSSYSLFPFRLCD